MPKLKTFSGSELIKVFQQFGFEIHSQKGSHIKLRRLIDSRKETLVIPNHSIIDKGTLKAIIRQSSQYIPIQKLNEIFYT